MQQKTRTTYVAVHRVTGQELETGSPVKVAGPHGRGAVFLHVVRPDRREPHRELAEVHVRWDANGRTSDCWARDVGIRLEPREVPITGTTPLVPVTARQQDAIRHAVPTAELDGWHFGTGSIVVPHPPLEALAVVQRAFDWAAEKYGANKFPAASLRNVLKSLKDRTTG